MKDMVKSKDELEKAKLKHEINNLKRWWIQPLLTLMGLVILFTTAINTNITEFLKIKSIEAKEIKANKRLDSTQIILHFKIDSLKRLYKAFNEGNKLTESYKKRIKISVDTIKNKDALIHYLKNQLDALLQHKVLNKELGGSYSNDFSNGFDNGFLSDDEGNIITTDDGQPIMLNENGKPMLNEDGKPMLNEGRKPIKK
jgi:hypothetical protein